jgi:hypothetical protein
MVTMQNGYSMDSTKFLTASQSGNGVAVAARISVATPPAYAFCCHLDEGEI